ncbi:MAG: MarR family transcriptional regulator [Clostridia bacterium]|jgi:DNA-binding MarR family transcriptional regulator|nr:MarR family transcriptional regulator [Clostridia bacterium]
MIDRFELFTVLISKISRNIRKIKNQEMAEYDLRSSHITCLYYLYSSESLTATDLCERCEEDKATVSRALDYLEKNEYLVCEAKSAKRYKSPLVLTEKGIEVGRRISEKIQRVLQEVSRTLTEEERTQFYRSLSIISNDLEQIANHANKTSAKGTDKHE